MQSALIKYNKILQTRAAWAGFSPFFWNPKPEQQPCGWVVFKLYVRTGFFPYTACNFKQPHKYFRFV